MKKYYVTGVLVSLITGAIFFELWRVFEVIISTGNLIFFIPVGILAGSTATKVESKFSRTLLKQLGLFLTIMMSIMLTIIIFNLVWANFLGWFY